MQNKVLIIATSKGFAIAGIRASQNPQLLLAKVEVQFSE